MKPLLLHARPLHVATGNRIDCRVGSSLSPGAYGLGGTPWRPAMAERPSISVELMSLDLDGSVRPATMTVGISLDELEKNVVWKALKWVGAPITLYSVEDLSWDRRVVEFSGEVRSHRLDIEDGSIRLTCEVSTPQLERNVLFAIFGGGGGIDGDADMRGTLQPAGWGSVEGIPPVWFDKTRWIGMLDGYSNTLSIDKLMEGAADMGPAVADYPTYAALAAAIDAKTIAPGMWGTCVAQGLVGLGAPPYRPIGVNATFGSNRLGDIIRDLVTLHANIPSQNIDMASLTAFNTAVPYDVRLWISEQRDVKQVVEALAASGNATPILLPDNRFAVTRGTTGTPVATLDRLGRQPPRVLEWQVADAVKPFWQIKARTSRPAKVLTYDEVNYEDDIIDRGAYDPAVVYRAGNLVWKADKSSYLYINQWASAGHALPVAPATQNGHWRQMTPPATAGDLTYADGTPIEVLRPAAPGSQPNSAITITNGSLNGIGAGSGTAVANTNISIGADGSLSGGGGGQVTIPGLGGGNLAYLDSVGAGDISAPSTGSNLVRDPAFADPAYWTTFVQAGFSGVSWAFATGGQFPIAAASLGATTMITLSGNGAVAPGSRVARATMPLTPIVPPPGVGKFIVSVAYKVIETYSGPTVVLYPFFRDVDGNINYANLTIHGNAAVGAGGIVAAVIDLPAGTVSMEPRIQIVVPNGQSATGKVAYSKVRIIPVSPLTELTDALGNVLSDAALLNSVVSIAADGSLLGGGGGQVDLEALGFVGDLDADLTAYPTGPNSASFDHSSTGTPEPGQFPRNFVYYFNTLSGPETEGVTWTYRIVEGKVNGFNASNTERAMTGNGSGTFTVNSLASNSAQVVITGIKGTKEINMTVQLSKVFAAPNNSGGGGGGGAAQSASQSSGFQSITSSTFTAISNTLNVTAGTANLSATTALTARYLQGGTASATIEAKLQRRSNGGSWVDMNAAQSFVVAKTQDAPPGPGQPALEVNGNGYNSPTFIFFDEDAAVTAAQTQEVRVMARIASGSTETIYVTGNFVIEA